jgi:hypothetical protein
MRDLDVRLLRKAFEPTLDTRLARLVASGHV